MARRPNWRLVKTHRSYAVEEIAQLFGVHKNTVRTWLKNGLESIDRRRPTLVQGRELVKFLRDRQSKSKTPLSPSHLYCVRCRAGRRPAGNMADYRPMTPMTGNLSGICPECDTIMNRRVALVKLREVGPDLEIAFQHAKGRIGEGGDPSVNCDFQREGSP